MKKEQSKRYERVGRVPKSWTVLVSPETIDRRELGHLARYENDSVRVDVFEVDRERGRVHRYAI